jgi:uncharacterized glyoxalase superfamily protein PhnB
MTKIQSVIPILVYEDIRAGHDFLVDVLGFESGGVDHTPDGTVVHAEVRTDEGAIWLHRVTGEHGLQSPRALPAAHAGMSVFVDDVDAHYERTKAAGADIERPPEDQEYGVRDYGVRDPEGHRFWFSQRL